MDNNTPLHPAITTLPPDSGQRHGDFLTAIPYNRSMYRTTLCLRVASILLGLIIIGVLLSQRSGDEYYVENWALGSPTAALGILWSFADIVVLVTRDRGVRWTKADVRQDRERSTRFSWGRPGVHVAGHLLIWAPTLALFGVVAANWVIYQSNFGQFVDFRQSKNMAVLLFFMFWLIVVHFSLFVFACVEVDNIRRQYSDVVFVPRGELREMVPAPPSTPMEIFVPRRMLLSFFANHYVRFVPGADGTVTVARDYSSRQTRS